MTMIRHASETFEQGPDGATISPVSTNIDAIAFWRESEDWDSDSDSVFTSAQKHSGQFSATAELNSIDELSLPFDDEPIQAADTTWSFWWRYHGTRADMGNGMAHAFMGKTAMSPYANWNTAPTELRMAWRIGTVLLSGVLTFNFVFWEEAEDYYFQIPPDQWVRWDCTYLEADSSWTITIADATTTYLSTTKTGFHTWDDEVVDNGPAFLTMVLFNTTAGAFQTWVDDINVDVYVDPPNNIGGSLLDTRRRFARS